MAGAIVTGAIVTGAIIMVITVGETSLPSCGDYSGRSRLSLAAFSFERRCLGCVATRESRQGFPRRLAVALRLRGGLLRRAVLEHSLAYLAMGRTPFMRCPVRCQCVGPTVPDNWDAVTSDDADQASDAVPSMKWPVTPCSRKSSRR